LPKNLWLSDWPRFVYVTHTLCSTDNAAHSSELHCPLVSGHLMSMHLERLDSKALCSDVRDTFHWSRHHNPTGFHEQSVTWY
jgi:hypothetical protein